MPRNLDEPVRMVKADDLGAVPRQPERRGPHGAAEVQRPGRGPQPGEVETLGYTPHRVLEGAFGTEGPRQDLFAQSVMEQEVFGKRPFGFVEVGRAHEVQTDSGLQRR